jgi:hypothetical protein
VRICPFIMDVDQTNSAVHYCAPCLDSSGSTHVVGRDTEYAVREIEAQNSISLSRALGTPNIASKGVLEQRAVSIPAALFPPDHYRPSLDKPSPKKLIEEVTGSHATVSKADGSNKPPSAGHVNSKTAVTPPRSNNTVETPSWTWSQEGGEIHITIRVPKLVCDLCRSTFNLSQTRLDTLTRPSRPSHVRPLISKHAGLHCIFRTSMCSTLTSSSLTQISDK